MCTAPGDDDGPRPATAVNEEERTLRAGDGAALREFVAQPATGLRKGAVLIIHDIWGYTDFYKDLARRIAAEGYAAALVDPFAREGDLPAGVQPPTRVPPPEDRARRGPAMDRGAKATDEQAMGGRQADVDAL